MFVLPMPSPSLLISLSDRSSSPRRRTRRNQIKWMEHWVLFRTLDKCFFPSLLFSSFSSFSLPVLIRKRGLESFGVDKKHASMFLSIIVTKPQDRESDSTTTHRRSKLISFFTIFSLTRARTKSFPSAFALCKRKSEARIRRARWKTNTWQFAVQKVKERERAIEQQQKRWVFRDSKVKFRSICRKKIFWLRKSRRSA